MGNICNCKSTDNIKEDTINIDPNNQDRFKINLFFLKMQKLELEMTEEKLCKK